MSAQTFQLPNLFSHCKFPLRYHLNGDNIASESDDWYRNGFPTFPPQQEARLSALLASNVAASIYDDAENQHVRAACDLMNLILLYGDFTDDLASQENQAIADAVADIFHEPSASFPGFENDSLQDIPVINLSQDFWQRCMQDAPSGFLLRFTENIVGFLTARRIQSRHRDTGFVPDLDTYITIRRDTSGLKPLIDFLEYTLQIDIPDHVINHPVLETMKDCTNDFATWSNDLYSFNKEQARDDPYNMVAILMNRYDMDLQSAVDAVGDMCVAALEEFEVLKDHLPSWEPSIDEAVSRYIQGLENWFVACLHWSFLSGRYFGKDGLRIRETHIVHILPKKKQINLTASDTSV
ncbi:hypothetical protein M422DRAFT_149352 [Sphaerobolus stellatus SS14]|nr:hypothetical protein M422DRAFT_149352 [Sphaerobolus stellatus SS14]